MIQKISFNRNELAGSFGDIGTDLPLIVAMIIAADLHAPSVLIAFGAMQIMSGLYYRMPMPVQPLKAMATIVITQKIAGSVLLGAGLAIGFIMLALSLLGVLDILARIIPKVVIRGIQLGLGISLSALAFREYIASEGNLGYMLATLAFILIIIFFDNKRVPASLVAITVGFIYAICFSINFEELSHFININLPKTFIPTSDDIVKGFILLALPQIPLSLGNSILATKQVIQDLYPDRRDISIKKLGLSYAALNLIAPFLSALPVCHGAGGMVGHHTFGGRTGGSVILYGGMMMILGILFGSSFTQLIQVFPLPILGVILLFEGVFLMLLIHDVMNDRRGLLITLLVGMIAFSMPYGFLIALVVGTAIYYLPILQIKDKME